MRLVLALTVSAVMFLGAGAQVAGAMGDLPTTACVQLQKAAIRADLASDSVGADHIRDVIAAHNCAPI